MKANNRNVIWIALLAGPPALLLFGWLGLQAFITATSTPLHPNAQDVTSVIASDPVPRWAGAVDEARQRVRAGLTAQNLPGMSVAVGAGQDIVWAEGFGWADLDTRVPVSPNMRFRIGSTSIALTSVAVGRLLEMNRLNLDEKIQTYVPGFPEKPWPVTLRQLMGHLAGISADGGDEESLAPCARTAEGLQRFEKRALMFEPGTQYRFSNYGWILVSAAVEAAAGERFFSWMRSQIFEPLGMSRTKPDSVTDLLPDRTTFYHPRFAADTRYGPEWVTEGDYSCFAGAGGLLSTPSDLVRFGLAINRGELLQPATLTLLQTSQRLSSGKETGYGLGWDLETVSIAGESTRQVGDDGEYFIGGSASFIILPERGIVVAVTTNTSFADTSSLARETAQIFATQGKVAARK